MNTPGSKAEGTDTPTPRKPRQRIRVKVLINAEGKWAAYGWTDAADSDADQVLYDMMSGTDTDNTHMVFLTADVPLPRRPEPIEAKAGIEGINSHRQAGLARAASLTASRRSEIARAAANARWAK